MFYHEDHHHFGELLVVLASIGVIDESRATFLANGVVISVVNIIDMCIADSRIDNSKEETKSFYTHVLHQPTLNPTSACNQIELCQTSYCSSLNCWTQQQSIILQCSAPAMNAVNACKDVQLCTSSTAVAAASN